MNRRRFIALPLWPALPALDLAALSFTHAARAAERETAPPGSPVVPGRALVFPDDEGSHPTFRIEWWYVTGWLSDEANKLSGFQITFFRNRPVNTLGNPSRFAPGQLLIAHIALSDPQRGRLLHDLPRAT